MTSRRGRRRRGQYDGLLQKGLLLGLSGVAIVVGVHFATALLVLRHGIPDVPDLFWMRLSVFCGLFLLSASCPKWEGKGVAFLWYMPLIVIGGSYMVTCFVLAPNGTEFAATMHSLGVMIGGFSCGSLVKIKRVSRVKYKRRKK